MSVICFASLKGGVGKTSLSVNISHAFSTRGCRTLLIDLDCAAHATRLFTGSSAKFQFARESELARFFLGREMEPEGFSRERHRGILEHAASLGVALIHTVRPELDLIPASSDLRYFLWGRGARAFRRFFPQLITELREEYDQIVIDTPPDLHVITRNSIACADVVSVPVDSSEMSIHCLEEIVTQTAHIKGPAWSIARTMVNSHASRVRKLVASRLGEKLTIDGAFNGGVNGTAPDFGDAQEFISYLRNRTEKVGTVPSFSSRAVDDAQFEEKKRESPIFLLRSCIHRTEEQNRLSFLHLTAFDQRQTSRLANEYLSLAKELDELPTLTSKLGEPEFDMGALLEQNSHAEEQMVERATEQTALW